MVHVHKAGLLHIKDGRVLLCRKKHSTSLLILPGGKLEGSETPLDCLRRECREEIGDVEVGNITHLGVYESPAAEGEGKIVKIDLFGGDLSGVATPHAEIKELIWFGPDDDPAVLAPSLRYVIFPDLRRRGIIAFGTESTQPLVI